MLNGSYCYSLSTTEEQSTYTHPKIFSACSELKANLGYLFFGLKAIAMFCCLAYMNAHTFVGMQLKKYRLNAKSDIFIE